MNKKISLTSLLAVAIFMAITFVTSNFNSAFGEMDKLGYPFVFFSSNSNIEFADNQSFSLIKLLANFIICFGVSYGLVSLFSLFKIDRKKAVTA
jgi:hypothetical protein